MPKVAKIVTTSEYHLWTDALHARALANQTKNVWDRGAYVRWSVNTAWTCFETACSDAFGVSGLGMRFRDTLDDHLKLVGHPAIDWSHGIWQQVLAVYKIRKSYTHVNLPQKDLLAPASVAETAIRVLRDAIKAAYLHTAKLAPHWVDDDRDSGWTSHETFGYATLSLTTAKPDDATAVRIAHVREGHEYTDFTLPTGTDPEPLIAQLIANTNVPISAVRIYDGPILREERVLQMRGA
jgi:hypothetical protein